MKVYWEAQQNLKNVNKESEILILTERKRKNSKNPYTYQYLTYKLPKEVSGMISENKSSHSPEDKNVSNYKVLTHSNKIRKWFKPFIS